MIDDIFVIDGAVHVTDFSQENLRDDASDSAAAADWILGGKMSVAETIGSAGRKERYSVEETYEMMFVQSPADMAMACVVPIFDWFKDWASPIRLNYELARAHPDRVLFCGGVDPSFRGLNDALEQLEYQVRELGARSIKFYNQHVRGATWRCDDEKVAYPMYEKCQKLGIRVLQFHKSTPIAFTNVEDNRPNDIQAPARDFPDLTFLVHHVARTYFDELVSIASRFPNVHVLLSPFLQFGLIAPRLVQEHLGLLLQNVGSDKLLYGSEGPLNAPFGQTLEAFLALEIPQDLRDGYGYPQITRQDKEKILGLNFARLFDVDIEDRKHQFAADASAG